MVHNNVCHMFYLLIFNHSILNSLILYFFYRYQSQIKLGGKDVVNNKWLQRMGLDDDSKARPKILPRFYFDGWNLPDWQTLITSDQLTSEFIQICLEECEYVSSFFYLLYLFANIAVSNFFIVLLHHNTLLFRENSYDGIFLDFGRLCFAALSPQQASTPEYSNLLIAYTSFLTTVCFFHSLHFYIHSYIFIFFILILILLSPHRLEKHSMTQEKKSLLLLLFVYHFLLFSIHFTFVY